MSRHAEKLNAADHGTSAEHRPLQARFGARLRTTLLAAGAVAALCLGVSAAPAYAEHASEPEPFAESDSPTAVETEPLAPTTDASTPPLAALTTGDLSLPAMRTDMLARLNQLRSTHGASPVVAADSMHSVAQAWAEHMARTGDYRHNPNLRTDLPAGWWFAAENIDTLPPAHHQYSPNIIVTEHMARWEGSAAHFINMKNTNYTHAGFGFALASSGQVFSVQVFAGYSYGTGPAPSQPVIVAGTPSISGVPQTGQTLTAARGAWTSANPITYSYQWKRNGAPIAGAIAQTYRVAAADEGRQLTVTVTGSAAGSVTQYATSAPVTITQASWPTATRISGADRFATAVNISKSAFTDDSVDTVVLATGYGFADALSAAPFATKLGGPLLLTQQNVLTGTTRQELQRLNPTEVIIVGGLPAVGSEVEAQLKHLGYRVTRLAGADRFATSLAIAQHETAWGRDGAAEVFLATGLNFPDALAAGAAAAGAGMPVVLVNGGASTLGTAQINTLQALGTSKAHIAGAESTVSERIAAQLRGLGIATPRYAGPDRVSTSAVIAGEFGTPGATVYLAHGWDFPDALAGAVVAGKQNAVMMLSQQQCLSQPLVPTITQLKPQQVILLGGTPALSDAVARYQGCG